MGLDGCTGANKGGQASQPQSRDTGVNMAGPQVRVHIPAAVVADKSKPWGLSTPQSAVSSYLGWISYAYRTATSRAATPTMNGKEGVRIDSYIQHNLEKKKLIHQKLTSLGFGAPTVEGTHTLVPTHEKWTFTYRSVGEGNRVLGGPWDAS